MSPRLRKSGILLSALALAALSLAGCISVFPKEKPAQLYRFGFEATKTAPAAAAVGTFTVRAAPISFTRAAAGDRILTSTGDQVAYIGGARWVTPAAGLFEGAIGAAFENAGGPARLLAPGEPAASDYILKADVRTFEVRYHHGPGSGPMVEIEVYAALVRPSDARDNRAKLFVAHAAPTSNSVHAIAAAFDTALSAVLTDVVSWANAKGAG